MRAEPFYFAPPSCFGSRFSLPRWAVNPSARVLLSVVEVVPGEGLGVLPGEVGCRLGCNRSGHIGRHGPSEVPYERGVPCHEGVAWGARACPGAARDALARAEEAVVVALPVLKKLETCAFAKSEGFVVSLAGDHLEVEESERSQLIVAATAEFVVKKWLPQLLGRE